MSLLQQDSHTPDDAAPGEELTKGSGHLILATVIAAVVVTIVIAIYVIAGQKPPAATGEVVRVVAHSMHRETSGIDASGAAMPKEEFDQVLVFTHVKLHSQSKNPLFLRQLTTNLTASDGTILSSYTAIPADYERLFVAFPDLAALHGRPLTTDATIPPGQTLEGDFVSAFRLSKQAFDARKGLTFNISFRYLPDLVLTPAAPIIEQ
jgi:hypothetical protein